MKSLTPPGSSGKSSRRMFDLSMPLEPGSGEPVGVEIERVGHAEGADILGKPAGITRDAFPDGLGLSLEHIRLTSHSGTHIDAPSHYGPLCEGAPARDIDALPLNWFFGEGVLLDCRSGPADRPVSRQELEAALDRIDYRLRPGDIVLLQTGGDRWWGTPRYFTDFRGVSKSATAWILDQGIKVVGIDSFGFDAPFHAMLEEYRRSGDPESLWPSHVYGRRKEYCQIERLGNLDQLPGPLGFRVCCFPVKLRGCGAAWSRVVAMVEE